jgi:hypothetical protein
VALHFFGVPLQVHVVLLHVEVQVEELFRGRLMVM